MGSWLYEACTEHHNRTSLLLPLLPLNELCVCTFSIQQLCQDEKPNIQIYRCKCMHRVSHCSMESIFLVVSFAIISPMLLSMDLSIRIMSLCCTICHYQTLLRFFNNLRISNSLIDLTILYHLCTVLYNVLNQQVLEFKSILVIYIPLDTVKSANKSKIPLWKLNSLQQILLYKN